MRGLDPGASLGCQFPGSTPLGGPTAPLSQLPRVRRFAWWRSESTALLLGRWPDDADGESWHLARVGRGVTRCGPYRSSRSRRMPHLSSMAKTGIVFRKTTRSKCFLSRACFLASTCHLASSPRKKRIGIRRSFHIGLCDKSWSLEGPRQLLDQPTSDIGLDVLQRPVRTAAPACRAYPEVLAEPEVSEDEDGDDDHPDDGEQIHGGPPALNSRRRGGARLDGPWCHRRFPPPSARYSSRPSSVLRPDRTGTAPPAEFVIDRPGDDHAERDGLACRPRNASWKLVDKLQEHPMRSRESAGVINTMS